MNDDEFLSHQDWTQSLSAMQSYSAPFEEVPAPADEASNGASPSAASQGEELPPTVAYGEAVSSDNAWPPAIINDLTMVLPSAISESEERRRTQFIVPAAAPDATSAMSSVIVQVPPAASPSVNKAALPREDPRAVVAELDAAPLASLSGDYAGGNGGSGIATPGNVPGGFQSDDLAYSEVARWNPALDDPALANAQAVARATDRASASAPLQPQRVCAPAAAAQPQPASQTRPPMAGISDPRLDQIKKEPFSYALFAAMRLLESVRPDLPRTGTATTPRDEWFAIGQEPDLAFRSAEVGSFSVPLDKRKTRMTINGFGLLGPNGPMPLVFTDYVRERVARGDSTLARFLDIFQHRLATLFYRAWASQQRTVQRDRPHEDRFIWYFASLMGLRTAEMLDADSVPRELKVFFTARLATSARNAEGLCAVVSSYFDTPAAIEEFQGVWLNLPRSEWTTLAGPSPAALGGGAVLGRRVWQCQQKFRLRLGPMSYAAYERLLPNRVGLQQLKDLVRLYTGEQLACEAQLLVEQKQVPGIRLGRVGRLGWSTWILNEKRMARRDRGDLKLLCVP